MEGGTPGCGERGVWGAEHSDDSEDSDGVGGRGWGCGGGGARVWGAKGGGCEGCGACEVWMVVLRMVLQGLVLLGKTGWTSEGVAEEGGGRAKEWGGREGVVWVV